MGPKDANLYQLLAVLLANDALGVPRVIADGGEILLHPPLYAHK